VCSLVGEWSWLDNYNNDEIIAHCSWSTDHLCTLPCIYFSRWSQPLPLYDSQLVLLGSLKVVWFITMLPIWKHTYLWSDRNGSSDTCQLLTRLLILFVYALIHRIFHKFPPPPITCGFHWNHTEWMKSCFFLLQQLSMASLISFVDSGSSSPYGGARSLLHPLCSPLLSLNRTPTAVGH
jgi:hypothetical protein